MLRRQGKKSAGPMSTSLLLKCYGVLLSDRGLYKTDPCVPIPAINMISLLSANAKQASVRARGKYSHRHRKEQARGTTILPRGKPQAYTLHLALLGTYRSSHLDLLSKLLSLLQRL